MEYQIAHAIPLGELWFEALPNHAHGSNFLCLLFIDIWWIFRKYKLTIEQSAWSDYGVVQQFRFRLLQHSLHGTHVFDHAIKQHRINEPVNQPTIVWPWLGTPCCHCNQPFHATPVILETNKNVLAFSMSRGYCCFRSIRWSNYLVPYHTQNAPII